MCAVADSFETSFERMRLVTNDFTVIATDDPLTVDFEYPQMLPNKVYTVNGNVLSVVPKDRRPGQFPTFLVDDLKMLDLMETRFYIELGDTVNPQKQPTMVKSRKLGDKNAVLYPISPERFYPPQIFQQMKEYDTPFAEKRSAVIWRGATTGRVTGQERFKLVEMYWERDPRVDVGFSQIVQGEQDCTKWLKPKMAWHEMIQYKYIMSLEGNDVASGLRWQLLSNSVVFMPPPTRETWFLEGQLVPYVHFIPVFENFTNIVTQLEWAEAHPKECEAIVRNATEYVSDVYANRIVDATDRRRVLELVLGRSSPKVPVQRYN